MEDSSSRRSPSNKGVYNDKIKARRIAEAKALEKPILPGQRELGIKLRFVGISSTRLAEGPDWTYATVRREWSLGLGGKRLSILPPPPNIEQMIEDGWSHIRFMWRVTTELLEQGGDPKYLVMNPLAKTKLQFGDFPTMSYSPERDVVVVDLVNAHEQCLDWRFLPVYAGGKEVALFRIHVKTESVETGTIRVYYHAKSRVAPKDS